MQQQLWETLLAVSEKAKAYTEEIDYCCFSLDNVPRVSINAPLSAANGPVYIVQRKKDIEIPAGDYTFHCFDNCRLSLVDSPAVPSEIWPSLQTYLPYCFLAHSARQHQRAIAVAHFAQSLDGKIATHCGDSRWIGNEENLIHAHRMRALCDGIIVGKKTIENDQPQLTVRHVPGRNPKRVVLGSGWSDFSSLREGDTEPPLVIGTTSTVAHPWIDYHQIVAKNGHIHGHDILQYLYQRGIHSVYIEGGAITTSNFLQDNAIDILQLHLSPYLFGSGKQGVVLPEIEAVRDCIRFEHFHFRPIGDSMMFVGQLKTTRI